MKRRSSEEKRQPKAAAAATTAVLGDIAAEVQGDIEAEPILEQVGIIFGYSVVSADVGETGGLSEHL